MDNGGLENVIKDGNSMLSGGAVQGLAMSTFQVVLMPTVVGGE